MAEKFNMDWARGVIDSSMEQAKGFVENPEQMNGLLQQLQDMLANLPESTMAAFKNVPLMASMVKDYITRAYTEVSPKVVISLVSAFLYIVKKKDLISDSIPIVGLLDDISVVTLVMSICEPELKAYAAWRAEHQGADPIDISSDAEVTS